VSPSPPPPSNPWRGEYFANPWLSGSPALVRNDAAIDFGWASARLLRRSRRQLLVRWTRTSNFSGGRYRFTTTTDDGVRLYVDGRLVMNRWYDMRPPPSTYTQPGSGNHTVRMEYFDHVGEAVAKLSLSKVNGEDKPEPVGNIITCARPATPGQGLPAGGKRLGGYEPKGYGRSAAAAVSSWTASGWIRIATVRQASPIASRCGRAATHPSAGNTAAGEPPFNVRAWADNYTPWGCP